MLCLCQSTLAEMQEDKAREELLGGSVGQVIVCSSLTGVRVKLYWWQEAGLGMTAECMFPSSCG